MNIPRFDFITAEPRTEVRLFMANSNTEFFGFETSGVVNGTTVRALVPGRLGQKIKNNKFERYVQRTNKNISNYIGGLVLWAADVCFRAAFAQLGPVSSISLGRFFLG